MTRCSIEPRTIKYVKWCGFLSFARNSSNKYRKQLLDIGLDSLKIASKKVVHKAGEFLRNNIADAVTNANDDKIVKPIEKIIIPPEKREETLNKLNTIKME